MENILWRENTCTYRNSILVENTNGFHPPVRDGQSMFADIDCRKDLYEIFCISASRVSLCWVKDHDRTASLK
jgi:hypothetical protein